ncbi:MAG: hydroxyethylthiazole kinase [Eubacteriales bacterium]|nr:hydroxyethylthiazole kinase [Eubacteriales bacterium]
MMKKFLKNVRKIEPLVHNITNYVTVNDVANVILACGASPIMADDIGEAAEITSICGGLNINIGTLNQNTIPSMVAAGKKSNELGHIVVLDPVGAGASKLRTDTANMLLKEVHFDAIRGNISEIKTLMAGYVPEGYDCKEDGVLQTKGVDANVADKITEQNLDETINKVKAFSRAAGSIIAITGEIDLVTDGNECYVIRNGRKEMSKITGTGCQLSGMLTAFLIANPDNKLGAAAAAVCTMGLAGEIAWKGLRRKDGNSTYRNAIIDAIYNMDGKALEEGARFEVK